MSDSIISDSKIQDAVDKVEAIEEKLNNHFVERRYEIHGLGLSIISGNNALLLGPPGVAKSALVTSWTSLIGGAQKFEWLLTKYSQPDELFGPYSLKGLEEDKFLRHTAKKLPEAHVAFIDEIFKGNAGILNSLLTILNERKFYNDGQAIKIPLLTLVGASNEIPESGDGLEAMFDRLILKYMVSPIAEKSNRVKMFGLGPFAPEQMISLEEIQMLRDELLRVEFGKSEIDQYAALVDHLNSKNFKSSDRTYRMAIPILKAEALLAGRTKIEEEDFDILRHVLWTEPENIKPLYGAILEVINPLKNKIQDAIDQAMEIFDNIKNADNEQKQAEGTVESIAKLKTITTRLAKYKKELASKNKDTNFVTKAQKKIDKLQRELYENTLGLSLDLDE